MVKQRYGCCGDQNDKDRQESNLPGNTNAHGFRPAPSLNNFTGCAGQHIFRGDRLPGDMYGDYFIPERTKCEAALGKGRAIDTETIQQFGAGSLAPELDETFEGAHQA